MKVRIKGNTIRLRLTQSEVACIGQGDAVSERTDFPGDSSLMVALVSSGRINSIACGFDGLEMRITLPQSVARDWATTDQVGIDAVIPNGKSGGLKLLIEKDFACLDRREDEVDAFPNPAACGNHSS